MDQPLFCEGAMQLLNSRRGAFALILVLSVSVLGQQKSASTDASTDAFIGKWRLNVDKSSLPPERETLAIENQASGYRIHVDVAYANGTELKFWTVTDMKGTPSKLTQEDGKPMNEEWRVIREEADAFVVDSRPFRRVVRYKVSPDGQTLTIREVSSTIVGGKTENGVFKPAVQLLILDRVQ